MKSIFIKSLIILFTASLYGCITEAADRRIIDETINPKVMTWDHPAIIRFGDTVAAINGRAYAYYANGVVSWGRVTVVDSAGLETDIGCYCSEPGATKLIAFVAEFEAVPGAVAIRYRGEVAEAP